MRLRWGLVLALAVVATIVAAFTAPNLEIHTSIERLLPENEPAAGAYRLFLEKFGGLEKLYVVIEDRNETPDPDRLADALALLAEVMEQSDLVASARYGLTAEDESFLLEGILPRAPLLDASMIEELPKRLEPQALRRRLEWIKAKVSSPSGQVEAPFLAADPLGLAGDLSALSIGGEALNVDPATEAFLSPSGTSGLVVITPSVPALDGKAGRVLLAQLDEAYGRIRNEIAAGFEFHATGGPLYAARDEKTIRSELMTLVFGSAAMITLLLALYFRGVVTPLVLPLAVLAGVIWTAALLAVSYGALTVLGISFGSILIGLGVDYGIHGASEFRRARLDGTSPHGAMLQSFRRVGPAILASVTTTAAAAFVLLFAGFDPIRELGLLICLGIVSILISSIAIGATLLVLLSGREVATSPGRFWRMLSWVVERLVDLGEHHRPATLGVASVLTLLAVLGVSRVGFNADLRMLRPADNPAEAAETKLIEDFELGLDSFDVVVRGASLGETLATAERVEQLIRGAVSDAVQITSPSQFLVDGELLEQRLSALQGTIDPVEVAFLREELDRLGFNATPFEPSIRILEALAAGRLPAPLPVDSWPDWLSQLVRVEPEESFAIVRVSNPGGGWPGGPPEDLVRHLEEQIPRAAIASIPRVGVELRELIGRELRRLTGWGLLAMVAVLLIFFRGRPRPALLSLLPVGLGCLWLLGICGALGLQIDVFSVAAAPLLLGIGIDDGLHAMHGARIHGSLSRSVRSVGPAMTITTLTTCLGFSGLIFSSVPALANGGLLISLGTLLCLLTSLVLLPALERPQR